MQWSRITSQRIATLFERVCAILLFPALLIAWIGVMVGSSGPDDEALGAELLPQTATSSRLFALEGLAVFAVGSVLLWGYYRHARGRSIWGGSVLLWLATVAYNVVLLIRLGRIVDSFSPLDRIPLPLLLWQLMAIALALVAAVLDLRVNFRRASAGQQ